MKHLAHSCPSCHQVMAFLCFFGAGKTVRFSCLNEQTCGKLFETDDDSVAKPVWKEIKRPVFIPPPGDDKPDLSLVSTIGSDPI